MGERKYFLDWLRVAAFFVLILFHVGMLYVTWGYNLKSERIYPDLEYTMNLVSPWRLALLFFISGVASRSSTNSAAAVSPRTASGGCCP